MKGKHNDKKKKREARSEVESAKVSARGKTAITP
jgi:hypothetical protein